MNLIMNVEDGKIKFSYSTNNSPKVRDKGKSLLELPSSYVLLDLETTGYSPEYDDIIEVGVLKVRDDKVIDTYNSLIYNDYIDEYITELTGITTEMTLNAPNIDIVLNELLDFIQDDIVIAHNANFDVNFLYDAIELNFNKLFNNDFVDTLRLARKAYPEFKTHRLKYLAENIPLNHSPSHRALSDCYTALDLYQNCKNKIINENIELKPKSSYYKLSDIVAHESADFDEENPLFDKVCVFTGTLEKMVRKEAMQAVVNIGGLVGSDITSKTDYLIVGIQDYRKFVDGKESSKMKKAKSLIENGKDLRIISEDEFYEMIFGIEVNDSLEYNYDLEHKGNKTLLQERIEELNSVIIDVLNNRIRLTGFLSSERLLDYYDKGSDCRFSVGLYPKEDFDIAYVKDNALVLIMENGKEIDRYMFIPIKKDTITYKNVDGKNKSRVFTIRHCSFSGKYNYKDIEKSLLFDSETSLINYFDTEYGLDLAL